MPADSDFDQALTLAQQMHDPDWASYTGYLTLRGKGFRKPALQLLNDFIAQAQAWTFAEQWRFTVFLLERLEGFWTHDIPLPQPLVAQLLRPALQEALTTFPEDPRPPYWLAMEGIFAWQAAKIDHQREIWFKESLSRDRTFQPARLALVNNILSSVEWHQHELPWGYLGVPEEDLQALAEAQSLLRDAESTSLSRQLALESDALAATASQYLSYRNSGEAFYRDWCDKNSLPYVYEEKRPK